MAFSSRLEGFGTAVAEAMSHELPVVARHLPGVNDFFIVPERTGFLFGGEDDFLAIMRRLIDSAALRARIGAAARSEVIERFSMATIAEQYLRLYGWEPAAAAESRVDYAHPVISMGSATSIYDRRFWTAAESPYGTKPVVVTIIDAEEDFDWSKPLSRDNDDVSCMRRQVLAQRIFERYGVVPIYLVDYVVASRPDGYRPLIDYLHDGRCEVGTQLHSWVNPPFDEVVNLPNSFLCNLPATLQYEKTRILTEEIGCSFGVRPRVHRAGRFGAGRRTADILKSLGYRMDCSVVPYWDFSAEGGPCYFDRYPEAYWTGPDRSILEVPVTAATVGLLPARRVARPSLFSHAAERCSIPAILAHTGLMERIKLTPEGITQEEARRLVRALIAGGRRIFAVTYHSSSLNLGSTPYVASAADLDRFLAWLDDFYQFFIGEIGGTPVACSSLYEGPVAPAPRPAVAMGT